MVRDIPVEKWFALEMGRVHEGLVISPRPLHELLAEDAPSAPTRGGGVHAFDKAMLERAAALLSPLERRRLRLPVTFYVDKDVDADAYVADASAIALLRALGAVAPGTEPRDGRVWLGLARARLVAARHASLFQFALL